MRSLLLLPLLAACEVVSTPSPVQAPPPPGPHLRVTSLIPGASMTLAVSGFNPSERVHLARGGAVGSGPCLAAAGGLCLDIGGPVSLLTTLTADATGSATRVVNVPSSVPAEALVGLQAVAIRGAGGSASVKAPAVVRVAGRTHAVDLVAGDLVVSEVMRDPAPLAPEVGGWIELSNLSGLAVDLGGVLVSSARGGAWTLPAPTRLASGSSLVLGNVANPAVNGGVPVDLAWGAALVLHPSEDDGLTVSLDGTVFDALDWSPSAPWPATPGASMSLDPAALDALAADDPLVWCAAPTPPGTPGDPNPACPEDPCGDGVLDPGEACDDGNRLLDDGCDATCQIEACPVPEVPRRKVTLTHANPRSLTVTPDGDLWVAQTVGSPPQIQLTRRDGETLSAAWSIGLSDTSSLYAMSMVPHPSGGVWVVGTVQSQPSVLRVGADGALLGTARFTNPTFDVGAADVSSVGPDGALYVGGGAYDSPQNESVAFVLALNPDGSVRYGWRFTAYVYEEEYVRGLLALRDGDLLVLVDVEDEIAPYNGASGMWIARLDPTGTIEWAQRSVYSDTVPTSAHELADGTLVIGGHRYHTTDTSFAAAFAPDGTPLWSTGINPRSLRLQEASLTVAPATCAGVVLDGDVCASPGTQCAGATGTVCACDGVWSCGARPQRIQLWGDESYLLDLDGELISAWTSGSSAVLGLFTRPDGGVRGWRMPFNLIDTDRDLSVPCDTTPVVPIAVHHDMLSWSSLNVTRNALSFSSVQEDTVRSVLSAAAPVVVCSELSCP